MLARLDEATRPEQLDLPGFRLHPLKGELAGFWSITVRANWRIIFRFEQGNLSYLIRQFCAFVPLQSHICTGAPS